MDPAPRRAVRPVTVVAEEVSRRLRMRVGKAAVVVGCLRRICRSTAAMLPSMGSSNPRHTMRLASPTALPTTAWLRRRHEAR